MGSTASQQFSLFDLDKIQKERTKHAYDVALLNNSRHDALSEQLWELTGSSHSPKVSRFLPWSLDIIQYSCVDEAYAEVLLYNFKHDAKKSTHIVAKGPDGAKGFQKNWTSRLSRKDPKRRCTSWIPKNTKSRGPYAYNFLSARLPGLPIARIGHQLLKTLPRQQGLQLMPKHKEAKRS